MDALLTLFASLTETLFTLTELAKRKTTAVRRNDLMELDQILKDEQAQALVLRGLDQKRIALLSELGLQDTPLSALPSKAPADLQQKARATVEALRHAYEIYNSAAVTARNTLECNLHEIERFLAASGADPAAGSQGYRPADVDAPAPMKTDFRA